jgi:NifU-like protein involved in Fe-S cluster formation
MYTNLIQEYAQIDTYRGKPNTFDISRHEGNTICGDDITIYIDIKDNKITSYHFDGNCSITTKAGANFLGDLIVDQTLTDIIKRNYSTIQTQGFEVSPRRKRAAVIALLAVRNAIHQYQEEKTNDSFDELIDEY